jgi:hypothetical protein
MPGMGLVWTTWIIAVLSRQVNTWRTAALGRRKLQIIPAYDEIARAIGVARTDPATDVHVDP